MLENAAESHTSGARFVGRFFIVPDSLTVKDATANTLEFYTQPNLLQYRNLNRQLAIETGIAYGIKAFG